MHFFFRILVCLIFFFSFNKKEPRQMFSNWMRPSKSVYLMLMMMMMANTHTAQPNTDDVSHNLNKFKDKLYQLFLLCFWYKWKSDHNLTCFRSCFMWEKISLLFLLFQRWAVRMVIIFAFCVHHNGILTIQWSKICSKKSHMTVFGIERDRMWKCFENSMPSATFVINAS